MNYMELKVSAIAENEAFVRNTIAAFCTPLNPSVVVLGDIKTAVSEAVSNCVIHAYKRQGGEITVNAEIEGERLHICITDHGCGIADIEKAKLPRFSTEPDGERAGIGFTIMEAFMDDMSVKNNPSGGVSVDMYKKLV